MINFYIAIVDYDIGNLKSIYKCLKYLNIKSIITEDPKVILDADGVILPGVGAFGDAMKHLNDKKLIPIINQLVEDGKPLLGICLGLQLLFSKSHELGEYRGLNLIPGEVVIFELKKVAKVPHIGWNSVKFQDKDHFLIQGIPENSYFYFVHSYYSVPTNNEDILGITQYGDIEYPSIVAKDNVFGTQFHPEKSSKSGIQVYKNYVDFCRK